MKTYDITVQKMRDFLQQIIDDGHGDLPFVVRGQMINGAHISPVQGIGVGPLVINARGYASLPLKEAKGVPVAYLETPAMIGEHFWRDECEGCEVV